MPSFFLFISLGFAAEFIDSSLGMLYGTLLSPILIIMGIPPIVAVPAVLFSQTAGSLVAGFFHQHFAHGNFRPKTFNVILIKNKIKEIGWRESLHRGLTREAKIFLLISSLGIGMSVLAAVLAVKVSAHWVKVYIALVVFLMGIMLVSKKQLIFSWKKIFIFGLLGAFNKSFTGGGFGPIVTSGQVVSGHGSKASIATTIVSSVPICLAGFITYVTARDFHDWQLLLSLTVGSILAAPLGALYVRRMKERDLKSALGTVIIGLSVWMIVTILRN